MNKKTQKTFFKTFNVTTQQLDVLWGKEIFNDAEYTHEAIYDQGDGYVIYTSNGKKNENFSGMSIILGHKPSTTIILDGIYLPPEKQGKGIGKKRFKQVIAIAQKRGTKHITADCARREKYKEIGYYVLATWGFDGLIEEKKLLKKCKQRSQQAKNTAEKEKFLNTRSINDLMKFTAGKSHWLKHGWTYVGTYTVNIQSLPHSFSKLTKV